MTVIPNEGWTEVRQQSSAAVAQTEQVAPSNPGSSAAELNKTRPISPHIFDEFSSAPTFHYNTPVAAWSSVFTRGTGFTCTLGEWTSE